MVRCITDSPGRLPGEPERATPAQPALVDGLDVLPPAIDALVEAFNIEILDYGGGPVASAQLSPSVWAKVVSASRAAGALRALRFQLGTAWGTACVEVAGYAVTITTAPDPTRQLVLIDLVDL